MTAPTMAPAAATLPPRIFSATSGCAASASSMAARRAPSSLTTASPRAATTSSGEPSPASTPSITWRASLSLSAPSSTSASTRATSAGVIGEVGELDAALVGDAGQLAGPPLARGSLVGAGGDGRLDEVERTGVDHRRHLEVADPPLRLEARLTDGRVLRQRRAQLLDPLARRRDRHEVGLGEVAVVLGVGLLAARRS